MSYPRSLALLTLLLAAAPARAEINMADSVEWMSADADLVIRGRVVAAKGTPVQGRLVWYDVTVKVEETLKGPRLATARFSTPHLYGESPLQWKADRTELLLYLVRGARRAKDDPRYGRAPYAPRRGTQESESVLRLGGPRPGRLFTMGYQVVTGRGPILAAARAAATVRGAKGRHKIDLPYASPAFKALYGGSAVWLYVPIDARLERIGVQWIASKAFHQRLEGAKVLAHFKSAANVRRLRGLLADPGFWTESTGQPGAPKTRCYAVREAAFKALAAWGIRVSRPVIREPAP